MRGEKVSIDPRSLLAAQRSKRRRAVKPEQDCVRRKKFSRVCSWQFAGGGVTRNRSLKRAGRCPPVVAVKSREPRENRGRLRHCNGLRVPRSHCPLRSEERRVGKEW